MTNPRIRVEFKKFGGLKYISHLDLQRALLRFIKRAGIPIRYTEGFNPHPKIVFGLTLSVGMESECELVDIYLARREDNPEEPIITPEELTSALSSVLPRGLEIVASYFPEKPFSDVVSSDYIITLEKKEPVLLAPFVLETYSHPVEVTKKTKSGEKTLDITPLIMKISAEDERDVCKIEVTLSANQGEYLNPDMVVKGLLATETGKGAVDSWQVVRTKINFKEN